jgi:hypothetical protein
VNTKIQEAKKVNFYIIAENYTLQLWLKSSLELTNISINSISLRTVSSLEYATFDAKQLNVILCGESIYKRLTKKLTLLYPNSQYNCSILVVTDSIDNSRVKALKFATIDHIPWANLTIFLLEHLLKSLIQDFIKSQKLQKLAHYDPLTNAANRRLFEDRADR